MELRANHVVTAHDGGDVFAVIAMGQTMRAVRDLEMIAVDEIGVIAGLYAVKHGVRVVDHQIVPPHMRHLQRGVMRRDAHDLTADPIKTGGGFVFQTARRQHLHPDANPHERTPALGHDLINRLEQAGVLKQLAIAGRIGPVARQDNTVRAAHDIGVRGDHHCARIGFAGNPLKRLLGRVQVAGFVINNRRQHSGHSAPLVDGISSALRGSVSTASRRARATDLNAASAMWWLFNPCSASMCSVMPPCVLRA